MRLALATTLTAMMAVSATADAATLFEEDELQLRAGSLARLGYVVEASEADFDQRPYFQFARLSAGVSHDRFGQAFVQVEGASGTVQLIDAFVEFWADEVVKARVGRFRLPTTADFLIGAPNLIFSNRSLLVSLYPSRMAGAELESTLGTEDVAFNVRLGWFQPEPDARSLLPDGVGNFASLRAGVDFAFGLGLHVAYLQLLLADNDLVTVGDPDPIEVRPVPYPQIIDAAVTFRTGPWDVAVEGLVAPTPDGDTAFASYAQLGYRFDLSNEVGLMPTARVGALVDEVTIVRTTAGVVLFVGDYFRVLPNYELEFVDEAANHTGLLTLQGSF